MVKTFEYSTSYPFPWTRVALGFFQRYPNPYSLHVLTVDVVHQELRDGKLYTKRLLTKTNALPNWGKRFFKNRARKASIIEESLIDVEKGHIETLTRNIGFTTRVMSITERNSFKASETNPEETLVWKMALIQSRLYGFRRALEAFGMERFRSNSEKANLGYVHALRRMEGKLPTEDQVQPKLLIIESNSGTKIESGFWKKIIFDMSRFYYYVTGSTKS